MLKPALKALLTPLARGYRRLTGIDLLEAKLDRIIQQNEMQGAWIASDPNSPAAASESQIVQTLYVLSEKMDALLAHRQSTTLTDQHISREIDRLDGYLRFYASVIREDIRMPEEPGGMDDNLHQQPLS